MFGLGKENKKNSEFFFELEEEIKAQPNKKKEIIEKVQQRLQQIKGMLRHGEEQEFFNQLGVILYGYTSLMNVIMKVKTK